MAVYVHTNRVGGRYKQQSNGLGVLINDYTNR